MAATTVVFQPEGRRTRVGPGEDLLTAAQRCGVGIEDLCGGRGTCGKCKVLVRSGADRLRPPEAADARLDEEDRARGARLACRTRAEKGGVVVLEVPPEAQRGRQRLQTSGWMPRVPLAPSIRSVRIVGEATPGQLRRRGYRLPRSLESRMRGAARGPRRLVVWQSREVLEVRAPGEPLLGMAFDIGSTKIAGFLVDLKTGRLRATVSAPNPQLVHGEDIMSRLAFAREARDASDVLRDELLSALNRLISDACRRAKVYPDGVFHVTAVGNPAMHHFFLGLPIDGLARAPYTPASRRHSVRPAGPFGLSVHPRARVDTPPVVAAFVGSDLVAGVLATRLDRSKGIGVFVDIGTNTEICAGSRDGLIACSTPSGPAFEGAHIRFGMRAADGAVERVAVEPGTLHVDYRTIGATRPRGLCGSALVDLLAELRAAHALDSAGRLQLPASRRSGSSRAEPSFVVVPAREAAIGEDIVLTQGDVGEIQLAKAAIRAGIRLLLDGLGREESEIRTLYLAGAFGTYLAPESARGIGMVPDVPLDRIRFVGNTAGSGARLNLLSKAERARMRDIARRIRHVSLADHPSFSRTFAASLPLPDRRHGGAAPGA